MSLSTTFPERTRQSADIATLLLLIWSVTVVSYLIPALKGAETFSTDDAMRLVEVRDFLAGQSWFDLTQYRLAPPEGVTMHWSRLIDLPLAALIRFGETLLPTALAERVATTVWPIALLLVFFAGVAQLARNLAGDAAARLALIFAALMAPVLQHFRPGAIDHHNAQLALLVWSLALAARGGISTSALAGALSALSLAIGQEMAPGIAALAAVIALRWIVQGEAAQRSTVGFALAFAAVTGVLFAATVSPTDYTDASCDALSIVHVVAAGIGGLGLALIAWLQADTVGKRFATAAALGALLAATIVLFFPACLGDPFAKLDPRLTALWLSNVSEARSIVSLWRDLPQEVLPYYGLPAAALALALHRCWREQGNERWPWLVGVAVLLPLTVLALWLVRGCAAANAVAAALVPAALVRGFPAIDGRAIFLGLGRAALILAAVINPLALIAMGSAAAHTLDIATGAKTSTVIADGAGTCQRAADYVPLAALPKGLVLAFIDAGPFLLLETPHSVLTAPYHRDLAGNGAMLDIFLGPLDEAKARIAALGVDYIAFCPGAPDRYNYARYAPQGLAAALARGAPPAFLERAPLGGTDLVIYRPRG